ncbi:GxxExxY protein [Geomonas nitrogeniifigens]|uniref:GxxExxY protein n=1 Tax=Geomonas diazotrophica TaxID=2843197 RepID=A0ABX8JDT5_9BACT|nr:GxxExxY protein [Geomonas nitrogeniifigens]QWV95938.1 GxxExxY protein [Geomonas nitrogeniifigens]QXE85024.1 GxxExxY protein [Geomonas nitrogeniifigens]
MIYEDLTGKILAACFDVSNELGNGFLESVYEKSLLIALEEAGLQAQAQVPLQVFYRKKNVGDFYADVVVEGTVLLELKAVKALAPEHVAQVLNYLKATGIGVGLLINFGSPKLEYRRLGNRLCG